MPESSPGAARTPGADHLRMPPHGSPQGREPVAGVGRVGRDRARSTTWRLRGRADWDTDWDTDCDIVRGSLPDPPVAVSPPTSHRAVQVAPRCAGAERPAVRGQGDPWPSRTCWFPAARPDRRSRPGTSKWNEVEHRLFSRITGNLRGRPLETYQTVVSLIANTTTVTGLDSPRRPRPQSSIPRNQADRPAERIHTHCPAGVPR